MIEQFINIQSIQHVEQLGGSINEKFLFRTTWQCFHSYNKHIDTQLKSKLPILDPNEHKAYPLIFMCFTSHNIMSFIQSTNIPLEVHTISLTRYSCIHSIFSAPVGENIVHIDMHELSRSINITTLFLLCQ